ncbi:MAG TPA: electron transport complex subunit RsxC [Novimethylophilus sp.]|jgi:electron transport complex protein RnfC|uniref:electron transport complex subunit RsxC n=1 Tax=Novimethylophilus sp. TaxID=2137426 RepID=UPI002F41B5D7
MILDFLFKPSFARGIHPPQFKETGRIGIRRMPFAPRLTVPLSQHLGKPARAIVRPGQEVLRGELIAEADGYVSVPAHAPVSGVVEAVELRPTLSGEWQQCVVIRAYEFSTQEVLFGEPVDIDTLDAQQIAQAVQDTGMVGLGGAAFPTHVKFAAPKEYPIEYLLVNGCECEPFLTADHRMMVEWPQQLVAGIRFAMKGCGAKRALIGVEDNKPDAIAAIEKVLPADGSITVHAVRTKYPQGAEPMLIAALLKKELPAGQRPYQIGVVMQNVGTLAELGRLLPKRQGLIERVVTVAGPGISKPGNYLVPIGTPLRFVLEYAGAPHDAVEVILGGPMMGRAIASLDVPVTKAVSGILVFDRSAMQKERGKVHPCIKCGECVNVCPKGLNPSTLGMLAAKREYELMAERYHLDGCFECGCCSYVCPSNIPLVQQFRVAKDIVRERQAA